MAREIGKVLPIAAYRSLHSLGNDDHLSRSQRVPMTVNLDGSIAVNSDQYHLDLGCHVATYALASSARDEVEIHFFAVIRPRWFTSIGDARKVGEIMHDRAFGTGIRCCPDLHSRVDPS